MLSDNIPIVVYYQAGLVLSIIICLGITAKGFQLRQRSGGLWLGLFMLAAAWWSLALLVEFTVTTIPAKIFWAKMEYWGIMGIVIFLLFFALEFSGAQQFLKPRYWPLYLLAPALILGLVWTNEYHALIWNSFTPVEIPGSNSLLFGHGPLFGLAAGYSYFILLVIALLFFRSALAYRHLHRRQAILITAAIFTPWLGNIIYIFNLGPIPGMDFTPFGFVITGLLLMLLCLIRWRLLELNSMIGLRQVFEKMAQGLVFVDEARRIVDINPAGQHLLNGPANVVGQPFADYFPAFADILNQPDQVCEVEWPGPPAAFFVVSKSTLLNRQKQPMGYVMAWRDISQYKQTQQELWQRRLTQAVLEERQHLSDELHAKTGQVLDHLAALAQDATRMLEQEHYAAAAATLAQQVEIARGSGANIEEFIHGLPPALAPPLDFFEALTHYTAHFSQTHTATVTLIPPAEPADTLLSPLAQIQLLRLMQESLLHLVQTGPALSAQVIIPAGDEEIKTIIISHSRPADDPALGIALQSRAESAGGRVEIRADAEQNGFIIIHLPRHKPTPNKSIAAIRILLVDDQEIVRESFAKLLTGQGLQIVGTAGSGPVAIEL